MRRIKRDNRGSSLVLVLVAMAFVGMLVSVILYMSLLNYKIKLADVKNKDSFYTAENALNEIKAGLQVEASDATGAAYLKILENYALYTDEGRNSEFVWQYISTLRNKLKAPGQDNRYQIAILTGYLQDTAWDAVNGVGAVISADTADSGVMLVRTDGIVLKDVTVTYTSSDGNVSRIKTDIKLGLPAVPFTESFKLPDILSYCMIANERVETGYGAVATTGSIYGGREGIFIQGGAMRVYQADLLVTDKNLVVNNAVFEVSPDSNLWAEGIEMNGGTLNFNGNAYIKDDLTINGDWSTVKISKNYYGYGYNGDDALDSSAILINGTKTTLDMSDVDRLYLAGHAYIKTAGSVEIDGTEKQNQNVLMGESLAVKSDQLAYLVPAECLWVDAESGKSLCSSNPITLEEAKKLEAAGAVKLDLSQIVKKLGTPLDSYAVGCREVYRNVSGAQLIYYYLTFNSELDANRFFKAYYTADKERMDSYLKVYLQELKLPVDSMLRLNLAGNTFTMQQDGTYELVDATAVNDDNALLKQESDGYANTFYQLCTILSREDPSNGQKTEKEDNGIFYNVINETEFHKVVPHTGDKKVWYDAGNNWGIVIVNNEGGDTYQLTADSAVLWDKVRIIVASGDVLVDRSYKGIVVAGGKLTVGTAAATMNADPEGVSAAMQITGEVDGSEYMAVNLFVGGSYVSGEAGAGEAGGEAGGIVRTEELVSFENWRKE